MQFCPKSKEEIDAMGLLKPGIYSFTVLNAREKVSKSGNDMIELTLEAYDREGKSVHIFDYLLEANIQKLFAFCSATGLEQKYHQGNLTSQDCIDKNAYIEVDLQKGKENPQGGTYPDKNNVKKYMAKNVVSPAHELYQARNNEPEFDSDVPF